LGKEGEDGIFDEGWGGVELGNGVDAGGVGRCDALDFQFAVVPGAGLVPSEIDEATLATDGHGAGVKGHVERRFGVLLGVVVVASLEHALHFDTEHGRGRGEG